MASSLDRVDAGERVLVQRKNMVYVITQDK